MPPSSPSYTLAALAERFGLELRGDGDCRVSHVGTLAEGGPGSLSFLANRAYAPQLADTRAGAVILAADDADACPVPHLVAPDPYLAFARAASLFDDRPRPEPGLHPRAVVHEQADLARGIAVGPGAVIGAGAVVGEDCEIGANTVIGERCTLGSGCRLAANVTLGHGVRLGKRVLVHPGAVIGADGFGIARGPERWEKVPQLGSVVVGDDCEIGANTCIDRGAIGDTVLEEDVRLDNHVQIGHNCRIGAHTAMAAFTGLSGSTRVGRNCLFAGRAGATGHLSIADGVTVGAGSTVSKDVVEPGTVWQAFIPAQPIRSWQRTLAQLRRLDRTLKKLQAAKASQGKPQ